MGHGASALTSEHLITSPSTISFQKQNYDSNQNYDLKNSRPKNYKQIVCWRWLENLCAKDDASCTFLHKYDQSRMPICCHFTKYGECLNRPDCVYKHGIEDAKECFMYNFGFCPNGPFCRFKHKKVLGPPPPVEQVFEILKKAEATKTAFREISPRRPHQSRKRKLDDMKEKAEWYHSNQGLPITNSMLPQGSSRYFIVKSNTIENLQLSAQRGMWATLPRNEEVLNEAFHTCDNVILIYSVNQTHHFQGCAKMTSEIGAVPGKWSWSNGCGGLKQFGRNFWVQWLKFCELPFHKVQHLKNPYNENLPVQISRDCQELEGSVGEQLVSLLFHEPDTELPIIFVD